MGAFIECLGAAGEAGIPGRPASLPAGQLEPGQPADTFIRSRHDADDPSLMFRAGGRSSRLRGPGRVLPAGKTGTGPEAESPRAAAHPPLLSIKNWWSRSSRGGRGTA